MRSSLKASLIAASLAVAAAAAAQTASAPRADAACPGRGDCNQPHHRGGNRQARHQAMTPEQHMARFDSMATQQAQTLQITAAQRPLWDAYVQTKKNMLTAKQQDMQRQDQDFARMPADERAELRARHLETAAQHARQIAGSTKALRNALTPEQRTKFDQMAMHGGGKHRFFGGAHHGKRGMPRAAMPANTPASSAGKR